MDTSNEASSQHHEGDRFLNASLVTLDLNHFVEQLRAAPAWKESDRNSMTIFKSDQLRIVLIGLHEGAELKTHTANGIITVQVLEGQMKFIAEPQTVGLQKGQMVTLQKQVPHSVVALKETFFLLTLAMV